MRYTIAAVLAATISCDERVPETTLRQAPLVLYISQVDGLSVKDFAEVLTSCDPGPIALTWTRYPQDDATGLAVVGLGMAAQVPQGTADCYEEQMVKLGAAPLP